jgi:GNAT superfamily N-acetyltransferase
MAADRAASVRLGDGTAVTLRSIRPDDKATLAAAFERLSETSRYRRFFTAITHLDEASLAYLTEVDHHDHEAIVAFARDTGEPLGVARYIRTEPGGDTAEAAVVVVDEWQRRGVGRALVRRLAVRARQEDVRYFTGQILAQNPAAVELVRGLGPVEVSRDGAEFHVVVKLPKRGTGARLARALRAAAAGGLSAPG